MKNYIVLIGIIFGIIAKTVACCAYKAGYDDCEVVMSGIIVGVEQTVFYRDSTHKNRDPYIKYIFKIETAYKGQSIKNDTLEIYIYGGQIDSNTAVHSSTSIYFEQGKKYIIYGYNFNYMKEKTNSKIQTISTNICTETKLFSQEEHNKLLKISELKGK